MSAEDRGPKEALGMGRAEHLVWRQKNGMRGHVIKQFSFRSIGQV